MAVILVRSFQYASTNSPGYFQRCESRYGQEYLFHKAFPMANRHQDPVANAEDNARLSEFFAQYDKSELVARLDEMPEVTIVADTDCDFEWSLKNDPRQVLA